MSEDFTELHIEGDEQVLRGFIAGFDCGHGTECPIFINSDHGVADDSFARQLAERAHLVETITHVIVAEEILERFVEALERHGAEAELTVQGRRPIARARCEFRWEVYSMEQAVRARRLFENEKPTAIELEGYDPEEVVDAKATDTALYTPAHALTVKARGHASGPPDVMIRWVRELDENDFIHVETIQLEDAGSANGSEGSTDAAWDR